jgi:hypothetical protein
MITPTAEFGSNSTVTEAGCEEIREKKKNKKKKKRI